MSKVNLIKVFVLVAVLTTGFAAFLFTRKSETQTLKPGKTPEKAAEVKEVADFRTWAKVNDEPQFMLKDVAGLCRAPTKWDLETSPHDNKFINVYVNSLGKDEMLTKKIPKFPVGSVIVKEKLPARDSQTPELLTVMIKREKGFNPEVGDWEFMTVNGAGTKITSRGKLANCQDCHLRYEQNDFVTRTYLPQNIWVKLK